MSGWKLGLLIAPMVLLVHQAAGAADLDLPDFAPPQAADPMVELGTGWYLRGDVGLGKETQVHVSSDVSALTPGTTYDLSGGVGYKFNTWLRTDLTYDYGMTLKVQQTGAGTTICPYALTGLTSQNGAVQYGYLWSQQSGTCRSKDSTVLRQSDVMLNAYADLGTWWNVTPYVGAGLGVAQLNASQSSGYYKTSDGSLFAADYTPASGATYPQVWTDATGTALSPQPTVPGKGTPVAFGKQDWTRNYKHTRYNLAWALMGGVGYALTSKATIDIGYRYINRGTYTSLGGANGTPVSKSLSTQEIRVGLRYQID